MEKYLTTIKDGREIYIPAWPVKVQLENLTTLCKHLGDGDVVNIASLNTEATKFAIMNAEDPKRVSDLVRYMVTQVRIAGDKITDKNFDDMFEGKLDVVVELFTHVVHANYNDFFS